MDHWVVYGVPYATKIFFCYHNNINITLHLQLRFMLRTHFPNMTQHASADRTMNTYNTIFLTHAWVMRDYWCVLHMYVSQCVGVGVIWCSSACSITPALRMYSVFHLGFATWGSRIICYFLRLSLERGDVCTHNMRKYVSLWFVTAEMAHCRIWTQLNSPPVIENLFSYMCNISIPLHSQELHTNAIKQWNTYIQYRSSGNKVNNMDAQKQPFDVVDTNPFDGYVSSIEIICWNVWMSSYFVYCGFSSCWLRPDKELFFFFIEEITLTLSSAYLAIKYSNVFCIVSFCCRYRPTAHLKTAAYYPNAPIDRDSDFYNFDYPNRGKAIIFNHLEFNDRERYGTRFGTMQDAECLQTELKLMQFDVDAYIDLKSEEVQDVISRSK